MKIEDQAIQKSQKLQPKVSSSNYFRFDNFQDTTTTTSKNPATIIVEISGNE
jgi:hypothetical protein